MIGPTEWNRRLGEALEADRKQRDWPDAQATLEDRRQIFVQQLKGARNPGERAAWTHLTIKMDQLLGHQPTSEISPPQLKSDRSPYLETLILRREVAESYVSETAGGEKRAFRAIAEAALQLIQAVPTTPPPQRQAPTVVVGDMYE